jgi:hypothetical protein
MRKSTATKMSLQASGQCSCAEALLILSVLSPRACSEASITDSETGHDGQFATTFNKSCTFISFLRSFVLYTIRIIMLMSEALEMLSIIHTIHYRLWYKLGVSVWK